MHKILKFLPVVSAIAGMSKNPKRKIGAIILSKDYNIVATGYNGCPRGVKDWPERYIQPEKQYFISHAEENAIAQAARTGAATDGCSMLITGLMPCAVCARLIVQAGITAVFYPKQDLTVENSRWTEHFARSITILTEGGVTVVDYEEQQ